MTTVEIVQRLLNERHITAEEAVTILKDTIQQNSIPMYVPNTTPVQPYSPPWKPGDIWYSTSSIGTPIAGSKSEGNE
jgi:hypothetical protein